MITRQRRTEESVDSPSVEGRRGPGIGSLLFATALGVGVGMLTAPDTGQRTRKQLRKRLATLSGEALDRWGTMQDRLEGAREVGAKTSRRMGKRMRKRLVRMREDAEGARRALAHRWEDRYEDDEEDEERGGGIVGTALWIAAGAGLAYLLTADGAAPARAKMQSAAADLGRRAVDRWDDFQRGGAGVAGGAESLSSDEAPQAS